MTVLMHDVDLRLLAQGTPNTTWSYRHSSFDVEYADDTLLFANTPQQMQAIFSAVEGEASRYGLSLNESKTVLLRLFTTTPPQPPPPLTFSNGNPIPEAASAVYLGAFITSDARQGKALSVRLAHASKEFDKLKTVWNSPLSHRLKTRIFYTIFNPMIMYGAPELAYTPTQIKRMDAWFMAHLRRVLRIKHSYWSRIPHHTALIKAGQPVLPSFTLVSRQLKHLDNILQLPTTHPAFHVSLTSAFSDKVALGKRRRGHPRQYWLRDSIRQARMWIEKTGFPSSKVRGMPVRHTAKTRPFDPLWLRRFTQDHPLWWKHVIKAPTLKAHKRIFPHRNSYLRQL